VKEIGHVMGGVSMDEGMRLGEYAAAVPADQAIVDIGVQGAASTSWLCMGSSKGAGAKVYGIDLWDSQPEGRHWRYVTAAARERAHAQIRYCVDAGHIAPDLVELIQGHSIEVAERWPEIGGRPIGLLHIDGMHTVEACAADIEAWTPYVAPGGIVVIHDWSIKTVRTAITDWLARDPAWERVGVYKWEFRPKSFGQCVVRRVR
jgi:cephalosporin hydroxylase